MEATKVLNGGLRKAKIATLGFGEAAQAFVGGLLESAASEQLAPISCYDIKIDETSNHNEFLAICAEAKVICALSPSGLGDRDVVFSLVTADRALEAAQSVAAFLRSGSFYLDCNSCSPATKKAASEIMAAVGVQYVDVAVMAPVHPARHRTPLFVSGNSATDAVQFLTDLGMNAKEVGTRVGEASSIKMLRSVMIKGLEALTAECMLAARRAGVEQQVLASLQSSDPGIDWTARSAYNLERMIVHGKRRAAEMREVATTLSELGIPSRMAVAASIWQDEIAALGVAPQGTDLSSRADAILTSFSS